MKAGRYDMSHSQYVQLGPLVPGFHSPITTPAFIRACSSTRRIDHLFLTVPALSAVANLIPATPIEVHELLLMTTRSRRRSIRVQRLPSRLD